MQLQGGQLPSVMSIEQYSPSVLLDVVHTPHMCTHTHTHTHKHTHTRTHTHTHTHAHTHAHTHTHTHTHTRTPTHTVIRSQSYVHATTQIYHLAGSSSSPSIPFLLPFPPLPLSLSLTLPQSDTHTLTKLVKGVCLSTNDDLLVVGRPLRVTNKLQFAPLF